MLRNLVMTLAAILLIASSPPRTDPLDAIARDYVSSALKQASVNPDMSTPITVVGMGR